MKIYDLSGSHNKLVGQIYDPSGSLDKTQGRIHDPLWSQIQIQGIRIQIMILGSLHMSDFKDLSWFDGIQRDSNTSLPGPAKPQSRPDARIVRSNSATCHLRPIQELKLVSSTVDDANIRASEKHAFSLYWLVKIDLLLEPDQK